MTFDPPERKAPGPFSHVIATRIYVRVTRFHVKSALKHGIVTLGTQSGHGSLSGKKSAEDARARRVERTSSIHDIAELPQRARAAVGVGEMTEFVVHT